MRPMYTSSCVAYYFQLCHLPITLEGIFGAIVNSSLYLTPHIRSHLVLLLPCLCYMSLYILPATHLIRASGSSHLGYLKLASAQFCLSSLSFPFYPMYKQPESSLMTLLLCWKSFIGDSMASEKKKKIQSPSIIFSPTVHTRAWAWAAWGYLLFSPKWHILFCLLAFGSGSFFGHRMHILTFEMES